MRQPSYFSHLSSVLDEVPVEEWRELAALPRAARVGGLPHRRLRRDQLRLLRPHPQRHARAAGPLEARRRASSRARSARPSARSTSRGTSRRASKAMMDELVANLLAAYRVSIEALDWMTEETKQRAYDKLDDVPPQDRLPREVPRLLRAPGLARRPARQRRRGVGLRDRPRARQDRLAGRPRRVVHAAADRQRLLQPRHQRDLLPGRHPAGAVLLARTPTRPRTTAASARSSGTRSATASTTRARSTTATATSTTGGPRPTRRRSR